MCSLRQRFLATIPFVVLLAVAYVGCSSDDNGTDPPPPQKGSIAVISTPPGALIYLDGDSTGNVTNDTLTNVATGNHIVKLVLEGYLDWDTTVNVTANATTDVHKNLESSVLTGSIAVSSTPTGAMIYLDGDSTGNVTNDTLTNVVAGNHIIRLELEGYLDWDTTVSVTANSTTDVHKDLESSVLTGSIAVSSTPTGAMIYLDGDSTGNVTNDTLDNIDPGDHTMRLVLDGYADWDSTVNVTANTTTDVNAVLQQEDFSLVINIDGNGRGRVLRNPDKTLYSNGELVELIPIPGVFWYFDGWSGDFVSSDSVVTVTMNDDKVINANFGLEPTPATVARVHGTIRRDDGLDLVRPVVFLDSSHTEEIVILDGRGWIGDPTTGEIAIQYDMEDLDSVHAIITGWDDLNENDTIEAGAGEPIGWWDWDGDDYWDNSHVWLRKGETITDADVVIYIMTAAATRRFSQPTGVRIESIK